MSSIYARLGFNGNDPKTADTVTGHTDGVNASTNLMPPLLNSWQTNDVAQGNVGGYYVNPVAGIATTITTLAANTVATLTNCSSSISSTITGYLANTYTLANTIYSTSGPNYIYITNRQSNVVDIGTDTSTPHYKTAIGTGKLMTYLTNQSDGIQNNSVMMGSFTSLTLGNTLNSLYNTMNTYVTILNSSITPGTDDGMGGITGPTSNISLINAMALQNAFTSIQNTLYTYPAQDTAFFTNSQSVLNDFTTVRQFSNLGQTETFLLNNYIGTPKILSRINSQ
jgi:hypothetical protein